MAIKISSVTVSPNVVNTGDKVTVTITANDVTWSVVKNDFANWNELKTTLQNWNALVNYH